MTPRIDRIRARIDKMTGRIAEMRARIDNTIGFAGWVLGDGTHEANHVTIARVLPFHGADISSREVRPRPKSDPTKCSHSLDSIRRGSAVVLN